MGLRHYFQIWIHNIDAQSVTKFSREFHDLTSHSIRYRTAANRDTMNCIPKVLKALLKDADDCYEL